MTVSVTWPSFLIAVAAAALVTAGLAMLRRKKGRPKTRSYLLLEVLVFGVVFVLSAFGLEAVGLLAHPIPTR